MGPHGLFSWLVLDFSHLLLFSLFIPLFLPSQRFGASSSAQVSSARVGVSSSTSSLRNSWVYREVKVGAVFEATRGPERSRLAPGVFVDQAGHKHYVARRGKAEDFGKVLYTLAVTYGLQRAHQLVVLGNGAAWIWRLVAEHFPRAVQIIDIWHAREHVWKVARAVFGPNTPEASAWAEHACSLLVEGKIEDLVEEIVIFPPVPPEPGTSRSVPDIERDYFISNAARMRYPAFRTEADACGQWHR